MKLLQQIAKGAALGLWCWCWRRWFLEDETIAKAHGIFQVTLLQAAMPAGSSKMQGIHTLFEFLEKKEQAFLCLLKLVRTERNSTGLTPP